MTGNRVTGEESDFSTCTHKQGKGKDSQVKGTRDVTLEGGGGCRPTSGKLLQGDQETMGARTGFGAWILGVSGPHGFPMWGDSAKGPLRKHLPPTPT